MANRRQTSESVSQIRKDLEEVNGVALREMRQLAKHASKAAARGKILKVQAELEPAGITAQSIAQALARGIGYLDHEDLQHKYFGLSMMRLVLRVRGDLSTPADRRADGGGGSAPVNLHVFINAIRELRTDPVTIETTAREVSHAADTNRSVAIEGEDS